MNAQIQISNTQLAVCRCVANGLTNAEIANTLNISDKTVINILSVLYDRLEDIGYRRSHTQLAILFLTRPEIFILRTSKRDTSNKKVKKGKKYFAIQMLKNRCHYKEVADRLGLSPSSVAVYKGNIDAKDFYTMPYLHKL